MHVSMADVQRVHSAILELERQLPPSPPEDDDPPSTLEDWWRRS
jgi:hypothetical protein